MFSKHVFWTGVFGTWPMKRRDLSTPLTIKKELASPCPLPNNNTRESSCRSDAAGNDSRTANFKLRVRCVQTRKIQVLRGEALPTVHSSKEGGVLR